MRPYTLVSSAAAPVFLIGGWLVAESLQPPDFDPLRDTISALAGLGATDRAVMTAGFVATGIAYLATALGLTEVPPLSRLLIALSGEAIQVVAAFPVPADDSGAVVHTVAATVNFVALAAWPLFAANRAAGAPFALRPAVTISAGAVLLGLSAWFAVTRQTGDLVGLAERIAEGAQAIWPFVVALSIRSASHNQESASLHRP
jgi:hypothetical membrane protein